MSWNTEAIILVGYKLPRDIWEEGFQFCEKHPDILPDYEDHFIDMDPVVGDGETFFGSIIFNVDDYGPAVELNSIMAGDETIDTLTNSFQRIFPDIKSTYKKYIGIRWI